MGEGTFLKESSLPPYPNIIKLRITMQKVMFKKGFPLRGGSRRSRVVRCRMRSIRDLNMNSIKNNAVYDGYTSSVAYGATFPSRGRLYLNLVNYIKK